MTFYYFLLVFVFLNSLAESRLVFPVGSDLGYIVADAPEEVEEDSFRNIEPGNDVNGRQNQLYLLDRKIREEQEGGVVSPYQSLWYPHSVALIHERAPDAETLTDPAIESLKDDKQGVKMGVSNVHCDDALTNLEVDWDFSPANYTCYNPRNSLPLNGANVESIQNCNIPAKNYMPQHFCMDKTIEYADRIPSFGDHRPLWPKFGEYRFVPPQRWLHNIEHGAVVMLYHPCTHPLLVASLKSIVSDCLYKHIITPFTPLTPQRPLALVAWGCTLEMSSVNEEEVKAFIKERALKGPEGILRKEGMFTEGLIKASGVPPGNTDQGMPVCSARTK